MIGSSVSILFVGGGITRDSLKTKPGATIDCFDGDCRDGVATGGLLLAPLGRFAIFCAAFGSVFA